MFEVLEALLGMLEAKITIFNPRGPDAKGLMDGFHSHLETSFLREPFVVWPADLKVNR